MKLPEQPTAVAEHWHWFCRLKDMSGGSGGGKYWQGSTSSAERKSHKPRTQSSLTFCKKSFWNFKVSPS